MMHSGPPKNGQACSPSPAPGNTKEAGAKIPAFRNRDQLEDHPKPVERISVYRRTSKPDQVGMVFICGRGRAGSVASGSADYEYLTDVDGEAVRETASWRSWVAQRHEVAKYGAVMPEVG